jgi:hypothetical protein
MSAILDLLYREYCRARLAEMRKQLLLSVASDEITVANWDASDPTGSDDRGHGLGDDTVLGDDTATKKRSHPVAGSCNGIALVGETARYPHTSGASRAT